MPFGFSVSDIYGGIIIDDTHQQPQLFYSGSASAAFTHGAPGVVTFAGNVADPILFVRAQQGAVFSIPNVSESGFSYFCSAGNLEWRVYSASQMSYGASGYGLNIYNASGSLIFNSDKVIPRLKDSLVALVSGDIAVGYIGIWVPFSMQLNLIKSIDFLAVESGLPFVNASLLSYITAFNGATMNAQACAAIKFISTTRVEIYRLICFGGGNANAPTTAFLLGVYPKYFISSQ